MKNGVLVGRMHGWFGVLVSLRGTMADLRSNFWDKFHID